MKVSKENLNQWLDSLVSEYQIIAPVKDENVVNYKKITNSQEIKLTHLNSKIPPKAVFFPQHEKLLTYKMDGKNIEVKSVVNSEKRILFGIRPCDAKSMLLLDKVFENDLYRDPYYCDKRDNTVIIGIGCNKSSPTCFCSSMNLSPTANAGSDVFLIDLGDYYYLETVSEKGKQLLQSLSSLEKLSDEDKSRLAQIQAAETSSKVDISTISEKLEHMFEHEYWDKLHEKCIGCNTCAFVCPTCHCFDITEEVVKNEGARVRTWDSCMAPLFTLHGSGHNPRDKKKARWRQRLSHKFNYFRQNNGEIACVGCGRCIRNCPVNFDIRQAIDGVNKADLVVK